MKKIILSALIVCLFAFDGQAQDDDMFSGFDKWQVRARAILFESAPFYHDVVNGVEYDFSTSYAPEIDITYFFSRKVSLELMLTTTTHDVAIVSPGGGNAGSVSLIPPTLNLQYHFYYRDFKPYLGIGLNYTTFYGEESGIFSAIDYKDDFGYTAQVGLDYMLSDKWFLNLDLKKMFLKTEATLNNNPMTTTEVNVDPIIAGFGVGMKF